jgi:tetratricopeptide (TPR) repeat protein
MQKGDYSGAIGEYRQALKLRPDLDHLRLDLALALEAKGERREALEEFEVVCARSPDLRECKENYRRLLKQFHMPPRP